MKILIDIPEEQYELISSKVKSIRSEIAHNGYSNKELVPAGWVAIADGQSVSNGEWILQYRGCRDEFYLCSSCNKGRAIVNGDYKLSDFKFCPNCGAHMQNQIKQTENNLTEKEVMIRRLSELPDEVIATTVVYATDFTKFGVDVTQQWNTAQEQHSELSKAYYRGYYDAMKRINGHLE